MSSLENNPGQMGSRVSEGFARFPSDSRRLAVTMQPVSRLQKLDCAISCLEQLHAAVRVSFAKTNSKKHEFLFTWRS